MYAKFRSKEKNTTRNGGYLRGLNSGIYLKLIKENPSYLTQFLLDCTSINLPMRINEKDPICSELFNLSRDFCHYVKKTRWSKLKDLESRK